MHVGPLTTRRNSNFCEWADQRLQTSCMRIGPCDWGEAIGIAQLRSKYIQNLLGKFWENLRHLVCVVVQSRLDQAGLMT
jgi:hypothetical protein